MRTRTLLITNTILFASTLFLAGLLVWPRATAARFGFLEYFFPGRSDAPTVINLPPPAPRNLRVTAGDSRAYLAWDRVFMPDLTHYVIAGETVSGPVTSLETSETQLLVPDLTNDVAYSFRVAAVDDAGQQSAWSPTVVVTPTAVEGTVITTSGFAVAAWFPTSQDRDDAQQSLLKNLDLYTFVSPFWYNQEADGRLTTKTGARDAALVRRVQQRHVAVVPSITNNYSATKTRSLLTNDGARERALRTIVDEVVKNRYDGIDLDFENVPPDLQDAYSNFVEGAARSLHARNKVLHVTVQPKVNEHYTWSGPGGMDYRRLGVAADRVRIMTYDFSRVNTAPGPIAPLPWMRSILQYAKTQVPARKILMGVPFYGYDWGVSGANNPSSALVWDGAVKTKREHRVTEHWNAEAGEPWYEYTTAHGRNVAYYQDARSIALKVALAQQERVGGIAIWRLGSEDPRNFQEIRKRAQPGTSGIVEAPQALTIASGTDSVAVSFLVAGRTRDVLGYTLSYGTTPEQLLKKVDLGKRTTYTLRGLTPGQLYYVVVRARTKQGMSPPSGMVAAAPTGNDRLSAVSTPRGVHVQRDGAQIIVTWEGDEHSAGYDVSIAANPFTHTPQFVGKETRLAVSNTFQSALLYVIVRAFDIAGQASAPARAALLLSW